MLISWCQFIFSCWWLTILSTSVRTFKRMKLLKLTIIGFIKGYIILKNNFLADVTFNPIQDEHFWGCSWMREGEDPAPKNLSDISYNNETWHSYTLPREDPKNIWITCHILWVLLTSAFFHQKAASFAISRNTDIDCLLVHNFYFF